MAKKRKPNHTSLVLPSDRKKADAPRPAPPAPADRLGRNVAPSAAAPAPPRIFDLDNSEDPTAQKPALAPRQPGGESLFDYETGDAPAPAPGYGALPGALSGTPPQGESRPQAGSPPQAANPPAAGGAPKSPQATPLRNAAAGAEERSAIGEAAPSGQPQKAKTSEGKKGFGFFKKSKSKPGKATYNAAKAARPPSGTAEIPEEDLPDNAIVMPRSGPRFAAVRRKKFRRRVGVVVVALVVVAAILLYITGAYLYMGLAAGSFAESVRIAVTPGGGWPASLSLTGYIKAEPMGGNGFVALGEKDCYIYSSTGAELWDVQHGYPNPGVSAGDTRICLYNRGGQDYSIEGRGETVARRSTTQDILFTEMSPGGWLALVTSSRYNATLQIFDPFYDNEPNLKQEWSIIDQTPVLAEFNADDRTLAVGCLSTEGGALGTTINVYRVGQSELVGTIRVDDARIVEAHYTGGNLLVYYDTYAALYNANCEEQATFDYGGRRLLGASTEGGRTALVLGSVASESIEIVLLDAKLGEVFTRQAQSSTSPQVLLERNGLLLMLGQEILGYSNEGVATGSTTLEARAYGLVDGGQPLALCAGTAVPLEELFTKPTSAAPKEENTQSAP